MTLVHDEALPPGRRAPVDRADAVARNEVADIGVLDALAFRARDLAACERLRLERCEEALNGYRARIRLEALKILEASLPRDESKHVTSPNVDVTDVEHPPARAPQAEVELTTLAGSEAQRVCVRAIGDLHASGRRRRSSSRSIVRSVRTAKTVSTTAPSSVRSCARSTSTERRGSRAVRVPIARRSANGAAATASSGRRTASAPTSPSGGERRVAEKSRARGPRHACGAAATSSARGVGTVSSTSRTTSSDETR